jgi:hypothetical protein
MSKLYRKTATSGRAALLAAAAESLDAELRRYAADLRKAGRTDHAALALYWARVVADAGPAANISSAVYAALRIGAAVERTNAERAFTTPVVRSRKASADRKKATAASAARKASEADKRVLAEFENFCVKERRFNFRIDLKRLRAKFLKTATRRKADRFRKLMSRT